MTGKDSTLGFTQLIDLEEHDNSEMKQAILNRTKAKYDRTLGIFDKSGQPQPRSTDRDTMLTLSDIWCYTRKPPGPWISDLTKAF
jgi:hypothetical protein